MKKILVAGVLNQPFASWPVASQSDDGQSWDVPVPIFSLHDQPTAIATDGTVAAIGSATGYLAITQDLSNFETVELSKGLGISGLGYENGDWIATGTRIYREEYGSYPAGSEVAQIYKALSPYGFWEMVWSHPETSSRIHQLEWSNAGLPGGTWVTCGSVEDRGDAWYSIDDGFSWTPVAIPAGVRRIISVARIGVGSENYWYWGSNGRLFRSVDLSNANWTQISIDAGDTITDIMQAGEWIVAVGTRSVYFSTDGLIFNRWQQQPYTFTRAIPFDNDGGIQWLIFARSQLVTKTYWTTSDFNSFEPGTNGMHVSTSLST